MKHEHAITNAIENIDKYIEQEKSSVYSPFLLRDMKQSLAGLEALVAAVPNGIMYAANHVRKLDQEIRETSKYPPSYKMRVPRDKNYCSDYQVLKLHAVAKLLNEAIESKDSDD